MHKAVEYYNQINALANQGVPIDWRGVASAMAVIVASEQTSQADSNVGPLQQKEAPEYDCRD